MPVQSIECLLTQAQMKRYLSGAEFSDEVLAPLEIHLKACPDCMAEANRQRELLGGAPIEVTQAIVANSAKKSPLTKVTALFKRNAPPQSPIPPVGENPYKDPVASLKSPKNLLLSASLAVVLVLMSTAMRNPTGMLGPRASEKVVATKTTEDPKVEEEAKSTETDKGHTKEPTQEVKGHDETEAKADSHDVKTDEKSDDTKVTEPEHHEPVKAVATHTTNQPEVKKEAEPTSGHHEEIGGEVLVADSAPVKTAPKVVTKPKEAHPAPVVKKAVVPKHIAPRRTKIRKKVKARPSNRVRVYLPNGSIKH